MLQEEDKRGVIINKMMQIYCVRCKESHWCPGCHWLQEFERRLHKASIPASALQLAIVVAQSIIDLKEYVI